jgi:tetratricopeptide (TPR) repeat protein
MNFFSWIRRHPARQSYFRTAAFIGIASLVALLATGCASFNSGDRSKLTRDEAQYELSEGDKAMHGWQFREAAAHYSTARDLLRTVKLDARQAPTQGNTTDASFNPELLDNNARFFETAARELYQAEDPVASDRDRLLREGQEAIKLLRTRNDFAGARDILGRLAVQARDAPSLYEIYFWNAQALLASYDIEEARASVDKSAAGAKRLASVGLTLPTPVMDVLALQSAILARVGDWDGARSVYAVKPLEDRYRDWEWRWMSESDRSVGLAEVALARAKAEKGSSLPYLQTAEAHLQDALKVDQGKGKAWDLMAEVEFLLDNKLAGCHAVEHACELGQCAQKKNTLSKCSAVTVAK